MAEDSIRRARALLGTFVEICACGAAPCTMEAAIEAAFGVVAKVHQLMSFHESGSDVSRLNRDAHAGPVRVAPWTYEVLQIALDLNRHSSGSFDVTVAPALQRAGLLPAEPVSPGSEPRAGRSAAIELLGDCQVRFLDPGVTIDLGGIAKGFAVDCAIEALKAHGVPAGLVNAGGDIAVFGPNPYPVHIRDPRNPAQLLWRVELDNKALASSGVAFDPVLASGSGSPAIIDPATEAPVQAIAGATVCATSCVIADALTKVVMIRGEASAALLDCYGASALIVSKNGDICFSSSFQGAPNAA
jgi:thiamine biosynthesis lipoprotein